MIVPSLSRKTARRYCHDGSSASLGMGESSRPPIAIRAGWRGAWRGIGGDPARDYTVHDGAGDLTPGEMVVDAADGPRCPARARAGSPRSRGPVDRPRAPVSLGRHEVSRVAVDDGGADASDGGPDDGRAAGHRLDRGDAERLVPRSRYEDVGRRVVVPQHVPAPAADESDGVADRWPRPDVRTAPAPANGT